MRGFAGLLVVIMVQGCITGADLAEDVPAVLSSRPIVVAVIDSGVNPYHPIFDTEMAFEIPGEFETISLERTGSFEERIHADRDTWAMIQRGQLYHIAGTRLLAISFNMRDEASLIVGDGAHGTATTYIAARNAPDAIIVIVQAHGRGDTAECAYYDACILDPTYAEAYAWVAGQPWIDVVSTSIGGLTRGPGIGSQADWTSSAHAAAAQGKIVISAAGNGFIPSTGSFSSGPPWIISVGGMEQANSGENIETAKGGVDVVSNWSEVTPRPDSLEENTTWGGTSFAAPNVAGALAHALHLIRQAEPDRVVTSQELRDAMNASALYYATTAWQPVPPLDDPMNTPGHVSIPILAQPQMGWGYVDASLAPEIARRVLEQDFTIPAGKEQAQIYQPRWQAAREEFWARYR